MKAPTLESTQTCPECELAQTETMPTDYGVWYWHCSGCATVIQPKPGDCCVYCSFASVPRPPVQQEGKGGCCGSSTESRP